MANLKELDPVQGLVDYVLDIKPYHTKIVEVLIEYVYNEPVDVTILDEHQLDVLFTTPPGYYDQVWDDELGEYVGIFVPGSLPTEYECDTGFDTGGYSTGGRILITSPNPGITFQNYPAINVGTNSFIINGNYVGDIKIDDEVTIHSYVEDFTNIYNIFDVNDGPAGTASFVIEEDPVPGHLVIGYTFNVIGAGDNNGTYTISSPPTSDGTYTTIPVVQSIPSPIAGGTLGIVVTAGNHSGTFTVTGVEFNGGSIDSWPDLLDPGSYTLGDNPHTIVTVAESLAGSITVTGTQSYVAHVVLDPIEIETALYYSRAEKTYDPLGPSIEQIPNEGTNRFPILGITLSTLVLGVPVPDTGKIVIEGDFRTSNLFVGDAVKIDSSTGNNGTYTITSIVYDGGDDETTLGVEEKIDDPTVDGYATLSIPSNVFIVDGDRTGQFTQGRQFDVFGGTFERTYIILNSLYTQGKTRVRVAESIFDIGEGNTIVGTTGGFQVPGDQTSKYTNGTTFNVVGSPQNDGPYAVFGTTTFDPVTGISTVPVAVTIDSTPGGELHLALTGSFRRHIYGFDENSPICAVVPESMVHVHFGEKIRFTGIGIELFDDVIAYNLENNDPGGFEFPLYTVVDTSTPAIPFQGTAPLSPVLLDLWFDTNNDVFRQWNGYEWMAIKKVYWFDTTNNMLHYRTIDKYVDTGWVLDSIRFPGYSDFIPAVGETEEIASEGFTTQELSPGVADATFTLTTPVPGTDETLLKVTINGIPAGFTLNSATEFTVTSPPLIIGDIVTATIFDRTATETNAHVNAFDIIPHTVLHTTVTVDDTNGAYVVAGGNFIDRFIPFNTFTAYDTTGASAVLGTWNTEGFPIVDVDPAGSIYVNTDLTWLFTAGRIFRVHTSDRNYNNFEVQSTIYNATDDVTQIIVQPEPHESTNDDDDITQLHFYNPPLPTLNVDNVADALILPGNVVESFPVNMEILVENSLGGNNAVWYVASATYDSFNDRTNVFVTGNIPNPDPSGNATVRTAIFQNYSKDLGVIIGAIFDPTVQPEGVGVYETGQPNTIVVPTAAVDNTANAIGYTWVGPVRFELASRLEDTTATTVGDNLVLDKILAGGALNTPIVDTDATANTFNVYYEDPVTSNPVNLTDFFAPGSIFTVVGSYGDGSPSSSVESNDAMYVVRSVTWDYTPAVYDTSVYPPVLITPASGSGETIVEIETDFDLIPPYNSFTVVSVSNNGDDLSTMELSGNHVNLFNSFAIPRFRLDEPILNTNPIDNVMEVTSVELVGGNTVLTIDNDFIDEAFTGAIGIIDAAYRGNVYWDEVNSGDGVAYVHGSVVINGSSAETLTAATFIDELTFGWGDVLRWNIVDVDQGASTVDLHGDFTAVIYPNDPVSITGSQNIDDSYDAVSVSYDVPSNISTVELTNPVLAADPASTDINVTIQNVSVGSSYFEIDGEGGDHVDFLRPSTTFDVVGSSANDGTYTVVSAVYNSTNDTIQVTVVEAIPSSDPSGDVQYQKKLAGKLEMDNIDITPWFQYNIIEIRPTTSEIVINGNVTGDVQGGQEIRILGTTLNNGIVTASSAPTFDALTNTSTLPVTEPLSFGENEVIELPTTDTIKVLGNSATALQGGDTINISGSTGNDGTYTVEGVSFDGLHSFITITTTFPDTTPDGTLEYKERGGWIESLRYQGISLRFEDVLHASITENADARLILTSGSLVDSWDYNYFDIGSFDEELGTLIHLYSNTF